jgi:excisionase family DNA binding protein
VSAEWLTVAEVAPLLGIGEKLVYEMSGPRTPEEKRIPCYRLGPKGGKLRFKREEIEGYIKTLRPAPPASPRDLGEFRPRLVEPRRRRP